MKKTTVPSLSIKGNCNSELCLVPSSSSASYSHHHHHHQDHNNSMTGGTDESPQHLTIFFDGKVSVFDVTELQAREILSLARREMIERRMASNASCSTPCAPESSPAAATPAVLRSQLQNPNGICMQRSLQRFLEKRKSRIQAASPYYKN